MEFITGGAYQGKLNYALNYSGYHETDVSFGELSDKPIVHGLEKWIRTQLSNNKNPLEELQKYLIAHSQAIIICDEIGGGIVPMEAFNRQYREEVGRIGCYLADKARRVHRVHCGIGRLLKDD